MIRNGAAVEAGYLVSSIALDTADHGTVVEAVNRLSAEGADGVIAIAPQLWVGRALAESDLDTPLVESPLHDGTPWSAEIGTRSLRLPLNRIDGIDGGHEPARTGTLVPVDLVVRAGSGPVPGRFR
ncbi:hypothetical protein GCM10027072_23520 [Streptomyces bullii]